MTASLVCKNNGKIVVLLVLLFAFSAVAYLCDDGWARIDTNGQHPTKQGAYDEAWDFAYEHMMFLGYSYGEVISVTYEFVSPLWRCAMTTRIRNASCRGLDVFTSQGTAFPPAGENLFSGGELISCSASNSVENGTTRSVCTGWEGTGSVPSSGSGNQTGSFSLNDDSAITWQWATEHWLDTSHQSGGAINVTDQWVRAGSQISIQATATPGYTFNGWTGTTSSSENPLVIDMNQAHTVAASFQALYTAKGTPHWWLIAHGLTNESMEVEAEADADYDGVSAWAEFIADTSPTNKNDYFHITSVSNNSPLTVHFTSSTNRLYRMEGCSNLLSGDWLHVPGTGPRKGVGSDLMQDTNNPGKGPFYRLKVELP